MLILEIENLFDVNHLRVYATVTDRDGFILEQYTLYDFLSIKDLMNLYKGSILL